MGYLNVLLNVVGLAMLAHSAYSAYEHSTYLASLPSYSPTTSIIAPLPLDIILEVLLSIGLVSVGVVASSPPLKPIQWSEWAGQIERQQGRSREGMTEKEAQELPANPFRFLEERRSFVDIRAKRQEFANWVRDGGKAGGKS